MICISSAAVWEEKVHVMTRFLDSWQEVKNRVPSLELVYRCLFWVLSLLGTDKALDICGVANKEVWCFVLDSTPVAFFHVHHHRETLQITALLAE